MKHSDPQLGDAVDRLIADHLQRATAQTDASGLLERIRFSRQSDAAMATSSPVAVPTHHASPTQLASRESSASATRPSALCESPSGPATAAGWFPPLNWPSRSLPVLVGLAMLIAFIGGRQFAPAAANAASLLRNVQSVHRTKIDRSYQVQYAPDPRYWDGTNRLEGPSRSILWTRGDRFRSDCSIEEVRLLIGREEDGSLWVSPSRNKGIRFPGDEAQLPAEVALLAAVNSMTVPKLIDEVLTDFELRVDGPLDDAGEPTTVIWARWKPGHSHPYISSALLEIDPDSQTLVRLVLWMMRHGQPRGSVTYTFLESAARDDDIYQLRAHLDDDAEIEHAAWQSTLE